MFVKPGSLVDEAFRRLHPTVAAWCDGRLRSATPPQTAALASDEPAMLIASPTGTGKTLAAFLPVMSRLAYLRDADELFPRPICLYISPLRALSYDIEVNLRRPLREMGLLERPTDERPQRRAGRIRERSVRTGVRTGDTPLEERRLMMARPPHVLITTPESLALMLALETHRKIFRALETVIVDEVHALAGNKRGAQVALLLEDLHELGAAPPRRIGLSATVAPLEHVAGFLAGTDRPCQIVDCRGLRDIRLDVLAPFHGAAAPLGTVARAMKPLLDDARTTLIFTNVRSAAERVAHELEQLASEPNAVELVAASAPRPADERRIVGVHHSALERNVRHRVEAGLRDGSLRTVVASSSLELGVDVGFVDRVVLLGGARGIAATLQRVGRSGHRPGAVAHGIVVAQDRDDLLEAAATKRCIAHGVLEEIAIPEAPFDVLAQWLVGSVVPERRLRKDEAFARARRAYPFRMLKREDLDACASYLAGLGVGPAEAHVRRIGMDGDELFGLGREASSAFLENAGTIPDERSTAVFDGQRAIGRLEESFASTLTVGDVFLLEGRALRVTQAGPRGLAVERHAGRPNVPQWSSHLKGIPPVLAREVGALRRGVVAALERGGRRGAVAFVRAQTGVDANVAAQIARYVAQQRALSDVADERRAVVEIYRMDGRQTAIFHLCAGRRVNETIARIVGARLARRWKISAQLTTDDYGFLVGLPAHVSVPDRAWAELLTVRDFERDLAAGLRASYLLPQYFRYVANTGLLVLRRAGGRTIRRGNAQWNAHRIFERLSAADPDFPLVREAYRVVTRDLLDAPAAHAFLASLEGEPRVIHPPAATPFSFGIMSSSFGDSVAHEDRAVMVEALHERVLALTRDLGDIADADDERDDHDNDHNDVDEGGNLVCDVTENVRGREQTQLGLFALRDGER